MKTWADDMSVHELQKELASAKRRVSCGISYNLRSCHNIPYDTMQKLLKNKIRIIEMALVEIILLGGDYED